MDVTSIIQSDGFKGLPPGEKASFLRTYVSEYQQLPTSEQAKFLQIVGAEDNPSANIKAGEYYGHAPNSKEFRNNRDAFIASQSANPGKDMVKAKLKDVAIDAMPYVRPALEMVGAVGGGILATPDTLGLGTAAGGIAGYALGKTAADALERGIGIKPEISWKDAPAEVGQAVKEGALFEAAGLGIGKAAEKAYPYIKPVLSKTADLLQRGLPLTGRNARANANSLIAGVRGGTSTTGEMLHTVPGVQADIDHAINVLGYTPEEAAAIAQSKALTNRLGLPADVQPTVGQMTGNQRQNLMEQATGIAHPETGQAWVKNDSEMLKAAQNKTLEAAGQGTEIVPAATPEQVGATLVAETNAAKKPIQAKMEQMEQAIPNAPMTINNFLTRAKELLNDVRISQYVPEDIRAFMTKFNIANPETDLHTVIGLRRTIQDKIDKEAGSKTASSLQELVGSLDKDLDKLSKDTLEGKFGVINGKTHDLDKLANELYENGAMIQKAEARVTPDYDAAFQKIMQDPNIKQIDKSTLLGDARTSAATRNKKIADQYRASYGEEVPGAVNTADQAMIADRRARNDQIRNILRHADPAADAAAMYRQYNRYAKEQYFDRFGYGDVSRGTAKGTEVGGTQMRLENIGNQYMNPQGASQLVDIHGQPQAAQLMLPHIQNDLAALKLPVIEGEAGTIEAQNVPKMLEYLNKNARTLDVLGLKEDAHQMVRDSIPNWLKAQFENNAKNAMTPARSAALMNQLSKFLREAGYTPAEITAFKDLHATIQMVNRNKGVTLSGNSVTAEKQHWLQQIKELSDSKGQMPGAAGKLAQTLTNNIVAAVTGAAGAGAGEHFGGNTGGVIGATAGIAATMMAKRQSEVTSKIFFKVLSDAATDPMVAKLVVDAMKGSGKYLDKVSPQLAGHIARAATEISAQAATYKSRHEPKQPTPEEIRAELARRGY